MSAKTGQTWGTRLKSRALTQDCMVVVRAAVESHVCQNRADMGHPAFHFDAIYNLILIFSHQPQRRFHPETR